MTPALKMWHTWQALSLVYRDAYFNQLNDRFALKWKEYQLLAETEKSRLRELGIGIVWNPLPKPDCPVLTLTPAAEIGGTFYFSVAVLNAAGEQSAPSPVESLQLPDGNAVDIQVPGPPPNSIGWNVYVGTSPKEVCLQNSSPLPLDTHWVCFPSTMVANGCPPSNGQAPNMLRPLPRLLGRG